MAAVPVENGPADKQIAQQIPRFGFGIKSPPSAVQTHAQPRQFGKENAVLKVDGAASEGNFLSLRRASAGHGQPEVALPADHEEPALLLQEDKEFYAALFSVGIQDNFRFRRQQLCAFCQQFLLRGGSATAFDWQPAPKKGDGAFLEGHSDQQQVKAVGNIGLLQRPVQFRFRARWPESLAPRLRAILSAERPCFAESIPAIAGRFWYCPQPAIRNYLQRSCAGFASAIWRSNRHENRFKNAFLAGRKWGRWPDCCPSHAVFRESRRRGKAKPPCNTRCPGHGRLSPKSLLFVTLLQ